MRLKVICCQVLTREMASAISRSPHSVELAILPMGLHDLGTSMHTTLQARIDAADGLGFDGILLGYALCGRGTEGLRAGKTQLVMPRAHDCIGILMGDRHRYQAYFDAHPGVYFRSPGWVEFKTPDKALQPAYASAKKISGERRSREELIAQYGEENGKFLFEQFQAYRRNYSGLTYISTGIESEDAFRAEARAEAEKEGWSFEEIKGSLTLLERLVNGDWDAEGFLIVPPGAAVQGSLGESILDAV